MNNTYVMHNLSILHVNNNGNIHHWFMHLLVQSQFLIIYSDPVVNVGPISQRMRCAALCSATRSCVSFSLDVNGRCVTKESYEKEGYNIV